MRKDRYVFVSRLSFGLCIRNWQVSYTFVDISPTNRKLRKEEKMNKSRSSLGPKTTGLFSTYLAIEKSAMQRSIFVHYIFVC
jgi:hypothetical protein